MPSQRFMVAYGGWFAALAIIFVTVRSSQATVIGLAGLTGTAAMVYSVRRHRPARSWPWCCLAIALVFSTAGQILTRLLPGPVGTYRPGSLFVYGLLLVMSAIMVAGVVGLARSAPRDVTAVIDVAILVLGMGLAVGVLVAVPYALTPDLPIVQAVVRVVFVARDVVLLAAVVHVATSERWNGSLAFIVCGVAGFLAYDALYRLALIRGVVLQGTGIEVCWLVFTGAWGMAALLPVMRKLGEPGPQRRSIIVRLGLLAGASALPVGLFILATFRRTQQWYEPLVGTVSAVMLALVLAQLLGVALRLRNQVAGERALSQAVTDVAAANDVARVAAVLQNSVPLLSTGRSTSSLQAAVAHHRDHGDLGPSPAIIHALGHGPGPVLAVPIQSNGHDNGPVLYLRGKRSELDRLWPRLDVLITQANGVLERIQLSGELIRRTTQEYLDAVAQTTGDALLLVDGADRITLASRSANSILGSTRLVGAHLWELLDEAARGPVTDLLRRARDHQPPPAQPAAPAPSGPSATVSPPANLSVGPAERVNTASWTTRRPDGTRAELEAACRWVTSSDPSVQGLLLDLRDVTEQRHLERELTERASRDPLTGLASGPQVRERVRHDVESRPDALIGLIVLDLNDFKLVNNQYGQDAGDTVLRTVADRLITTLPPGGLAARISADRFALVITVTAPSDADELSARLLAAITQPIKVDHATVTCTASAGIATSADTGDPQELARQADLALLNAQDEGRGRWHHYDPAVRSTVLDRLQIRAALEHALDEHALRLLYQPIVELRTGVVAGFEALLRWRHPAYRGLSPETFIDVAEESKLIIPIGDWALATATNDARRWDAAGLEASPFVAVNVSSIQFESPAFGDRLGDTLAASGLPASRLHLEITESALLHDETEWKDLQRLRTLGIQIAIDDFGTGYSALSYLSRVPADRIKLDRQFVASMVANPTQHDLVAGILRLTRILHLDVIAEGIETNQERDLAAEVGCRFGQGYLFARPMPIEATLDWLAHHKPHR